MNSFYAEQKGLFTMYLEQEEEMQKLKMHRKENPELYKERSKRRFSNKKRSPPMSKIVQNTDSSKKLSPLRHSSSKHILPEPVSRLFWQHQSERPERLSEIFHRRQDKNIKNSQSIEYRVLEQRPVVEPEILPRRPEKPKRKPSSNKFCPQRQANYVNKSFLPMIGSLKFPKNLSPEPTHNKYNSQSQQSALDLIFGSVLNVEGSSMMVNKNKSQVELKKQQKIHSLNHVNSQIVLTKAVGPSRQVVKWHKLRLKMAHYNFPS